ncbi:MAG: HAD family hydrolase [Erysipelothrix sp.]
MNHSQKRVFIDLDGTLLNSEGTVSSSTKLEIEKALNRNIEIWICSGRPYCFTRKISDSIDERIKTISYNGCMIESSIEDSFTPHMLKEILELLNPETLVIFKSQTTLYSNKLPVIDSFAYRDEASQYSMDEKQLTDYQTDTILKVLILEKNKYAQMKEALTNRNLGCTIAFYENLGCEITPLGINKGSAVRKLRQENDTIIGIGNDMNDVSLFEAADIAVAMKNSHKHLLSMANVITSSNDQDGVGKYLETL